MKIELRQKDELKDVISQIASDASPVGMDAVYVHALILEKLAQIEKRLTVLEGRLQPNSEAEKPL